MKLPAPNRIAVYVAGLAGLVTALLPIVTNLGLTEVASVLGGLLSVTAVLLKFLTGWQQMEDAEQKAILIERQRTAALEVQAAEAELVAAAGKAGRNPNLKLPR